MRSIKYLVPVLALVKALSSDPAEARPIYTIPIKGHSGVVVDSEVVRDLYKTVTVRSGEQLKAYVSGYLRDVLGRNPTRNEVNRKIEQALRDNGYVDISHLRPGGRYKLTIDQGEAFSRDMRRVARQISGRDPQRVAAGLYFGRISPAYLQGNKDVRYEYFYINLDRNTNQADSVWRVNTGELSRRDGVEPNGYVPYNDLSIAQDAVSRARLGVPCCKIPNSRNKGHRVQHRK